MNERDIKRIASHFPVRRPGGGFASVHRETFDRRSRARASDRFERIADIGAGEPNGVERTSREIALRNRVGQSRSDQIARRRRQMGTSADIDRASDFIRPRGCFEIAAAYFRRFDIWQIAWSIAWGSAAIFVFLL